MCGRCIGSFSIHAYARAALLPPYHAWLNGAHAKRNDRFLAQVYLMPRVEEGGAPYLACVAPHATASAADDMVYNLASACKRPGRASYLGNSKVDFCRSFIFPRRTAKLKGPVLFFSLLGVVFFLTLQCIFNAYTMHQKTFFLHNLACGERCIFNWPIALLLLHLGDCAFGCIFV